MGLIAAVLVANAFATHRVLRSDYYSAIQKSGQLAIVWLIPFLGVTVVWSFLRAQINWEKYDTRAFPEPTKKMLSEQIQNSILESANHIAPE